MCVCVCERERECVYPCERDNEVKVGSYFGRQVDQGDRVRVCTHVKERERVRKSLLGSKATEGKKRIWQRSLFQEKEVTNYRCPP